MITPTSPPPDTQRVDSLLVRGIAWTGGLKWLTHLVSWTIALIVARLVTPTGYGLFAMAVVYIGFVQLVNELGLGIALVQRRELPEDDIAQLGGLAVLAGLGFCAVSIAVSPAVASFFGERALRGVLVALSFTFVPRGAQVVPRALLARELNFRRLAWINTLETSLWSGSTLIGATLGFGYWALVGGAMFSGLVTTIMLCAWRPHRLAWPHDVRALAATTRLAWYVVVSQICWYLYDHADLTPRSAWSSAGRPSGLTPVRPTSSTCRVDRTSAQAVGQVTPAVFAASQREVATLKRHLLGLTEGLALVTFPMSVGLALTADVFVLSVLGEAWRPAILPLRLLGLLGGFRAVFNLFPQMLIATGHARLNAKMNIIIGWTSVTLALCAELQVLGLKLSALAGAGCRASCSSPFLCFSGSGPWDPRDPPPGLPPHPVAREQRGSRRRRHGSGAARAAPTRLAGAARPRGLRDGRSRGVPRCAPHRPPSPDACHDRHGDPARARGPSFPGAPAGTVRRRRFGDATGADPSLRFPAGG